MSWIEERKTSNGCLIQISKNLDYQVTNKLGLEILKSSKIQSPLQPIPKIVFLGNIFKLDHLRLGEVIFVNVKVGKILIPYQTIGSNELKFLTYINLTSSDTLPVIVYHKQTLKDLMELYESGNQFHNIVVEESQPKNEIINMKIRYPNVNISIIKKKLA